MEICLFIKYISVVQMGKAFEALYFVCHAAVRGGMMLDAQMFLRRLFAALAVAVGLSTAPVQAQSLEAGVARVDITPPTGLVLEGYPGAGRFATGVRDPLFARILVLQSGTTRVALVDLDLIAVFEPTYLTTLRERVQGEVPNLLVTAIHTHSGPALILSSAPPRDWESSSVAKISRAIHEAATNLRPVRLGVGYGVAYLGHNRLRENRDGSVTWFEKNWTAISTAPVDPAVAVLRIDDVSGKPIAILVNYACHPVIFGPDSRLYSADFPGVTTEVVEQTLGGKPLCFFLQGGPGDINPLHAVTPLEEGAVELAKRTGTELARAAVRVAQQIHPSDTQTPSLHFREDYLSFRSRWDRKQWLTADPTSATMIAAKTKSEYQLPVTTLLINEQIAFLGMPGEPFVAFQMQWR